MKEVTEYWDKANDVYYGKDRDFKNFPPVKHQDKNPPTRLGFIPESFFANFYEKTGVTGPYLLGTGVLTVLFSKELWVVEHGFAEFVSFWLAMYWIMKKFGPKIGQYLDDKTEAQLQKNYYQPLEKMKANSQELVDDLQKAVWRQEGQKYIFEASRENVDLQLEAVYRQRLSEVQSAVKKRLEYQVAKDQTKRRVEQEHMVTWIVDGVVKGVTPQQEKDSITKCISDLKALAAQQ